MAMASAFIPARCAFPTSFDTLWKVAAFCGIVLIIITCMIFWQKRLLRQSGYRFLMGATLVGGIWSFALAIVTSRNYLVCAGVPGASAALIQSANENYQTLLVFQSVVGFTTVFMVVLVLISVISLGFSVKEKV